MARTATRMRKETDTARATNVQRGGAMRHDHRTAKVVEVIGASTESFDDAMRNALEDASETTRGITGAHVANMSVKCDNGRIVEYKVDLMVAFGIERTSAP